VIQIRSTRRNVCIAHLSFRCTATPGQTFLFMQAQNCPAFCQLALAFGNFLGSDGWRRGAYRSVRIA
jgi:hypothetical protein